MSNVGNINNMAREIAVPTMPTKKIKCRVFLSRSGAETLLGLHDKTPGFLSVVKASAGMESVSRLIHKICTAANGSINAEPLAAA